MDVKIVVDDSAILAKLDQVWTKVDQVFWSLQKLDVSITNQGATMAGEIEALAAEVTRNTAVDDSVVTLLTGMAATITSLKNDPVKLQAYADSLRVSSDKVAAAVVANTPAAPNPPNPPDPIPVPPL